MSTIKHLSKTYRMKNEEARAVRRQQKNMRLFVHGLPMFRGKRVYVGRPFRLQPKALHVSADRISGPDMPEQFYREGRPPHRPGSARRRGDITFLRDPIDVYVAEHKPSRSMYGVK